MICEHLLLGYNNNKNLMFVKCLRVYSTHSHTLFHLINGPGRWPGQDVYPSFIDPKTKLGFKDTKTRGVTVNSGKS